MENLVNRPAMFGGFYAGKRVLVTGHTGFKGSWLSLWLHRLGAEVHGVALPPDIAPSLYGFIAPGSFEREWMVDIRDAMAFSRVIAESQPQLIFHLAAQPLVQRSYSEPLATFQTNAVGTAHLLEAVRTNRIPCDILVVTTDKCYMNREWDFAYREDDPLGGHDPYSMSKAAAELVAASWKASFFDPDPGLGRVVTARAGNVIGGGDFSENRIVPDCARALAAGQPIRVRNPHSIRPWQHVLDCVGGYLLLAARIAAEPKNSPVISPFNFGPTPADFRTVEDLVTEFLRHWPGIWENVGQGTAGHEAGRLRLAIDKASERLGWVPQWGFIEAVRQSVLWYRRHAENANAADLRTFTREQIAEYEARAIANGANWAN